MKEKKTPFASYANEWFETYKQGTLRHTTEAMYRSILTKHLIPYFGPACVEEINTPMIQRFLKHEDRACLSKKSQSEILKILRMILDSAVYDHIIELNHAKDRRLAISGARKRPRKALSEAEYADVLIHIPALTNASDRRFMALIAYTGMRREEAFGLRWSDVDFANNKIHISTTITFKGNHGVEGITKTESGTRDIPLPEPLKEILLEPHSPSEFVVRDNATSTYARRMWERICRQIDVHEATPHCFRHTWTTFAHAQGVDDKTLQSLGGWCDVATMRDVYTHTLDSMKKQAVSTMDGYFDKLKRLTDESVSLQSR